MSGIVLSAIFDAVIESFVLQVQYVREIAIEDVRESSCQLYVQSINVRTRRPRLFASSTSMIHCLASWGFTEAEDTSRRKLAF